ncbi:MAG: MFS transporter [Campylobacterales bacterium]|nr:MFS transporter [Campylobacterales bacterium]
MISIATKITLLLISMTTMMSNVAIITALPRLGEHFPHEPHIELLSRLMITLPSLSIALLAPFLGHWLAPFGRSRTLGVALLFFALFGSAGLYVQSIEALLLSRALFGVAVASLMILTTALVGDYFDAERRHRYMGLQSAFSSIGGLALLVGGGWLSDIHWRYAFGIYLLGLLYIPLALRFIKAPQRPAAVTPADALHPSLWRIYLLAFTLMLLFYLLPTQMPFLMINHFGASGALTGSIIASAFIFNALGALSFAKLKQRFDYAQIYLIGMVIVAVGFVFIGLVRDVRLFFITSPIMGFGGGILMTNVTAWMLSKSHHSRRVRSSGYLTGALFMG